MSFFKPTPRQISNWKNIEERGKARFIRVNFISFGLNMIFFALAFEYINTKPIHFTDIFTPEVFLGAVISGVIGGLIFSFGSWFIGNWRFGKHIKD